jgi:hypothetical protein
MQPLCHHCSTPRPGHASFMCDPLRNANEERLTTLAFDGNWHPINASTWDPHQLRNYALARLYSNHPASTLPQGDTLQQHAPPQPLPTTTLALPRVQPPNFNRPPPAQPPTVYDASTQHYLQFQPDGTATSDSSHPPPQQGLPLQPFTYSLPPTTPTAPTHPRSISPTAQWVPQDLMPGHNQQATFPLTNPTSHNIDNSLAPRRTHQEVETQPSDSLLQQRRKRRKCAQGPRHQT